MWVEKKPEYGDHIRVNRGLYYHHGIYIDDNNIVQFGSITNEIDPSTACVMISDLPSFLKNGVLEVREYTEEELKKKRTPSEIVNYALLNLNRKGYNLISNNCEHFANECVFGEAKSNQVDDIKNKISDFFNLKN